MFFRLLVLRVPAFPDCSAGIDLTSQSLLVDVPDTELRRNNQAPYEPVLILDVDTLVESFGSSQNGHTRVVSFHPLLLSFDPGTGRRVDSPSTHSLSPNFLPRWIQVVIGGDHDGREGWIANSNLDDVSVYTSSIDLECSGEERGWTLTPQIMTLGPFVGGPYRDVGYCIPCSSLLFMV